MALNLRGFQEIFELIKNSAKDDNPYTVKSH